MSEQTAPDTLPPTQGQIADLIRSMGLLSNEIDSLRADLRRANFRTRVATVLAICAVALTVGAIWVAIEARSQTRAINSARAEARVAGCVQDNKLIAGIRVGIVSTNLQGILTFAADPANLTDEEQAAFDAYAKALGEAAEEAIPLRDCSDAGIDAYFSVPVATSD